MSRHLLVALFSMVMACANPTDDTKNVLVVEKASGPCGELLVVGDWYRFTSLAVTALGNGGSALTGALNGLWAKDIAKRELSILFEVVSATKSGIEIRMISGARTGSGEASSYCLLPVTQANVAIPIGETGIGPSEETDLVVFAGSETSPKNCAPADFGIHGIPVTRAVLSAGCDVVAKKLSGTIEGALRRGDIKVLCTCFVPGEEYSDEACGVLDTTAPATEENPCAGCVGHKADGKTASFLSLGMLIPGLNGGKDLDYECQDADGAEAACLTATFDAERIESVPPECGQ